MAVRRPRLLVIDPSIVWPEDEGVAEIVGDWPGSSQVLRPALRPGDGPAPGDPVDAEAVVIMGSRASVHDDRPWLAALGAWLDPLVDGRHAVPLLGICFGHQLIAARAGGRVVPVRRDRSEERGVKESHFVASRLVPGGGRLHVVASHGEQVETAPPGFRVVASREHVRVDALEHDRLPIFAVQFHPEARREFLAARSIPPGPHDDACFADQARLLAAFRDIALAAFAARALPDDPD